MKCDLRSRKIDGCYGWIVVVMSFLVQLIADGINFTFGTLMVELLEDFELDRSQVAVTGSVLFGMLCFTAPFAAALCDSYGCRVVVVSGAIISCTGLVIRVFATSIVHLYFSYGLLTGIGLGLMYLPANVCVIWYFNKYRGIANGIAVCGSGIGMFVLNNLGRYLIDIYGWRGFVMLEGGMCLQCAVFGLLLWRPIQETEIPRNGEATEDYSGGCISEIVLSDIIQTGTENPSFQDKDGRVSSSIRAYTHNNHVHILTSLSETSERSGENGIRNLCITNAEETDSESVRKGCDNEIKKRQYKGSLRSLCNSLCSTELLRDKRFWAMILSTFVIFLSFPIPVNFIADHAIELGMSKYEASWLVSSIGISNAAGRVLIGLIADRKFVNKRMMFVTSLFLAGISTGVSFLLTTFISKMVYTCLYGMFIGGYITLLNVVLAEIFGTERIAKSFGLLLVVIGISASVSSPIAGLLYDKTGNYNVTFVVAGSDFIVGGLLLIVPVHFCKNHSETT